jgi:predicted metal-dependent peptidase
MRPLYKFPRNLNYKNYMFIDQTKTRDFYVRLNNEYLQQEVVMVDTDGDYNNVWIDQDIVEIFIKSLKTKKLLFLK